MRPVWLASLLLVVMLLPLSGSVVPQECPSLGTTTICDYTSQEYARYRPIRNLYFAIAGLFDVRQPGDTAFQCGNDLNPSGVMYSHAFLWALNHFKAENRFGNDVAIGGIVLDSCQRPGQMIQNILGFEQCTIRIPGIDRHNVVGFVGPTNNRDAEAAAQITSSMDLTVISPSADSPQLSDTSRFPYFLRTSPTIQYDVDIMASVLTAVNVKHIAVVYEQEQRATMELFRTKMNESGICISFLRRVSADDDLEAFIEEDLRQLEVTRFVAMLVSPTLLQSVLDFLNMDKHGEVNAMHHVFLLPSHIGRHSGIFTAAYVAALKDAIVVERGEPLRVSGAVTAFKSYWKGLRYPSNLTISDQQPAIQDPFLDAYRSAGMTLPEVDVTAASTVLATLALMEGVLAAGNDSCRSSSDYLCTGFFNGNSRGSLINQNVRTRMGYLAGSNNLNPSQVLYKVNRFNGTLLQIGEYSNNQYRSTRDLSLLAEYQPGRCHDSPCLQCGELPRTTTSTLPPTTTTLSNCRTEQDGNFSIVYYPPNQEITGAYMESSRSDEEFATRFEIGQRWIIALGVLAGLGILAVVVFEIYILYKLLGTHMGQKWRTMWLGQLLLFGIFLCYLTLFAYLPIPTKATCGITRFGVGVSYSICFAVLLVKLMVILTSKTTDASLLPGDADSPNYLRGIYQFLMFVFVVGVQVVIDAQWLITVPPEAIKVVTNSGAEHWVCNHYTFSASGSMTAMSNFVRNEFENHLLSLVYIMFLILITTLLALNAHGIITNHRESVFIGIASGFSIPIWLAWSLVGGLNRDDDYAHEYGDACIAFGLFLTATLILFAMFLPKVRQLVNMGVEGIYFEDDRDTYYAGSVIMAPPSYKSRPNSVIQVSNQGIYSEPVIVNGDMGSNYMRHPGSLSQTPGSTYSAPPTYLKRGGDSTLRGGSVLRVTDDLSGRRPLEKKRPMSEVAYGTAGRPRSHKGTLPRARSINSLGAL